MTMDYLISITVIYTPTLCYNVGSKKRDDITRMNPSSQLISTTNKNALSYIICRVNIEKA